MHGPANRVPLRTGAVPVSTGHKPLPLLLSLILLAPVCLPWAWVGVDAGNAAEVPTTPGVVKWHPGHYYAPMTFMRTNPSIMAQVYAELKATPALRGLQVRFTWPELEPEEGRYDFKGIEKVLTELAPLNKHLIILLELKSFNPQILPVPTYMRTEVYEGGAFPFSTFGQSAPRGHNLKLWNSGVHDRLVALVAELGKRFNGHVHFEGIGLPETAMGQPIEMVSSHDTDKYYDNLLDVQRQMRAVFPNTLTYQFVNYPREILAGFVDHMRMIGTGLGGPDIFLDDPGLNFDHPNRPKGVYFYYPQMSGLIPLTPSIMQANYDNTRHDGKGRVPTVAELLAFGRDRLRANYLFWTRAPGHFQQVLEQMQQLPLQGNSAGGLDAACPKAYVSCVE
ncbi:MAG: glycoside hydrolase [Nitrospira sp.]|nr:glycoside hydrolase [Nitrospira sp.]